MKLWIDDVRPAPEGYFWCKSVNKAIDIILASEVHIELAMKRGSECFAARNYTGRNKCYVHANKWNIELIDIDHDAGEYACQGGDYIKLLDWLEETGRNYPIRIHSMNPVGIENMRAIIRRNGWTEVM